MSILKTIKIRVKRRWIKVGHILTHENELLHRIIEDKIKKKESMEDNQKHNLSNK